MNRLLPATLLLLMFFGPPAFRRAAQRKTDHEPGAE